MRVEQVEKDGRERDGGEQCDDRHPGGPSDTERFESLAEHHDSDDLGCTAWASASQLVDQVSHFEGIDRS